MTMWNDIRIKEAKKVLRKNRMYWQKIIAWGCFSAGAVLIVMLLLYLFVWSRPVQPSVPKEMEVPMTVSISTPAPTPIRTTKPEPTRKLMVIQESFKELYEQNSDIVGWITLPGTPIDYPIMQTTDNEFYMTHDFNRNENMAGSLYLDFRCDYTNMYQAAHHIVYGHNMKNGSMFQALTLYEDELFFNDNLYISINTLYGNYTFEVFAAYETPVSFYYLETEFADRQEWLQFIEVLQEKSLYQRDVVLTEDDVVVTLSTCTNKHIDNLRFVVHARLVNPEIYDTEYTYIY